MMLMEVEGACKMITRVDIKLINYICIHVRSYHGDEEEIPWRDESDVVRVGVGESFDVEQPQHQGTGGNPSFTKGA